MIVIFTTVVLLIDAYSSGHQATEAWDGSCEEESYRLVAQVRELEVLSFTKAMLYYAILIYAMIWDMLW